MLGVLSEVRPEQGAFNGVVPPSSRDWASSRVPEATEPEDEDGRCSDKHPDRGGVRLLPRGPKAIRGEEQPPQGLTAKEGLRLRCELLVLRFG
jgi:hypothetical protein